MSTERFPDPTEFDRQWRAAALADRGHCTYPEAVPGYRAHRAAQRRTRAAESPRKCPADLGAPRPAEPIIRTDHDTGGMIAHFPKPLDARPDAPVTVDDIRQVIAAIDQAATDTATRITTSPTLATDNAVQALRDAIARAAVKPSRRWYDPRTWWRR